MSVEDMEMDFNTLPPPPSFEKSRAINAADHSDIASFPPHGRHSLADASTSRR